MNYGCLLHCFAEGSLALRPRRTSAAGDRKRCFLRGRNEDTATGGSPLDSLRSHAYIRYLLQVIVPHLPQPDLCLAASIAAGNEGKVPTIGRPTRQPTVTL